MFYLIQRKVFRIQVSLSASNVSELGFTLVYSHLLCDLKKRY